ncbi:MAG: 2-C-methyl-D-erythritol 4-phosphate cytidylyltransferase [Candidatus Latescibacterota bacterium]
MHASAIIVAGGKGRRMGTETPKQLLMLEGKTILERTLYPFVRCQEIGRIIVVAAESILSRVEATVRDMAIRKDVCVVAGGRDRQESVWNGLTALPDSGGIVAVHDAVRPFITSRLITGCIDAAARVGAVTVARPVKETIKAVENGVVIGTLDRSMLWIVQTPQAFRAGLLIRAHEEARREEFSATDDCMLVERLGHPVHIIEGGDTNIKITTPADLRIAGAVLELFESGGCP